MHYDHFDNTLSARPPPRRFRVKPMPPICRNLVTNESRRRGANSLCSHTVVLPRRVSVPPKPEPGKTAPQRRSRRARLGHACMSGCTCEDPEVIDAKSNVRPSCVVEILQCEMCIYYYLQSGQRFCNGHFVAWPSSFQSANICPGGRNSYVQHAL